MVGSLAALRQRVSQESDYILFDEVVKCLRAEARRAAYIVTWLSAAESLRNKFLAMASRDAAVGRIVGQIEEAERQAKPTDKFLLDKAAELGMIGVEELRKLEHIRDMRNFYAHPTGTGPSKEEVLAALRIVVASVLSKAPLLRHGYVNDLMQSLFEERHYLDDISLRIRDFAVGVAHRVHSDVVPYLIKKCAERIEPIAHDPGAGIFRRRGVEFGAAVLAELRPDLSSPAWDALSMVSKYPAASSMLFSTPEIWPLLPEQCKGIVIGHLLEPIEDGKVRPPSSDGLKRAKALSVAGLLEPEREEKLAEIIASAPLNILKAAALPLRDYSTRIISELASHNWYAQNPAADALYNAGPEESSELDPDTQEQLGRNILQAADGTAASAEYFVRSVLQTGQEWPQRFVEGLLLETMVNEGGNFRLKERHFVNAILIATKHPCREAIFQLVAERVRNSTSIPGPAAYDTAMGALQEYKQTIGETSEPYFDVLREALESAKASQPEEDLPF